MHPLNRSSQRNQPPLYTSPPFRDRLFYLLLTITASMIVYKSYPKNLRGREVVTLAVGSFGLYRSLGCKCVKNIVKKIFNGCERPEEPLIERRPFLFLRDGGFFASFGLFGSATLPPVYPDLSRNGRRNNPFRSLPSSSSVDPGPRQSKRREEDVTVYPDLSRNEGGNNPFRSLPSSSVDPGPRQSKRREEDVTVYPDLSRNEGGNNPFRSLPSSSSVDPGPRQSKRREENVTVHERERQEESPASTIKTNEEERQKKRRY